jgi:nicotinate-nucleotide adenylyltransferase
MTETLGIFGGSFDPPHAGHVMLAAYALSVAPIDRLLVVPTFQHPFGKVLAAYDHRVAMCERAFAAVLTRTSVSRVEEELGGDSYTVRTLEELARRMPDARFRLIVGADVLKDTSRWRAFERVKQLAPPFIVGRGGEAREGATDNVMSGAPDLPAISSTFVRAGYGRGADLDALVPRFVDAYVRAHGLYRADASSSESE